MKLFIDVNVLVCVLNKELPRFTDAARVLSLAHQKIGKDRSRQVFLYTTPLCLAIAFYFASKKHGVKKAKAKIDVLMEHMVLALIDEGAARRALNDKRVEDLEDGFQYYAAVQTGCERIITYNKSDFYFSDISVMQPDEFIYSLKEL